MLYSDVNGGELSELGVVKEADLGVKMTPLKEFVDHLYRNILSSLVG